MTAKRIGRGTGKRPVAVGHGRVPSAAAAARMEPHWKAALEDLRRLLEESTR